MPVAVIRSASSTCWQKGQSSFVAVHCTISQWTASKVIQFGHTFLGPVAAWKVSLAICRKLLSLLSWVSLQVNTWTSLLFLWLGNNSEFLTLLAHQCHCGDHSQHPSYDWIGVRSEFHQWSFSKLEVFSVHLTTELTRWVLSRTAGQAPFYAPGLL
jgi:hypothetical protein